MSTGRWGGSPSIIGTGLDVWEVVEVAIDNSGSVPDTASYLEIDPRLVEGALRYYEPSAPKTDDPPPEALPRDASRMDMMRRVKNMSVEERVDLFDRLSRDAAWARSAKRIR